MTRTHCDICRRARPASLAGMLLVLRDRHGYHTYLERRLLEPPSQYGSVKLHGSFGARATRGKEW